MRQIPIMFLMAALSLAGCGKRESEKAAAPLPDPTPSAMASLDARPSPPFSPRDLACFKKLWEMSVGRTDAEREARNPSELCQAFVASLATPEAVAILKAAGADKDSLRSLADELRIAAEFQERWDKRAPELEQHRAGLLRLANDARAPAEKRLTYAKMLQAIESELDAGNARREALHGRLGDLLALVGPPGTSGGSPILPQNP
ncbi:MAG: glycosyltransferase family 4 protein [Planctomycetes bacterium]|nr:glycosyltransferase family 4 protein [Planctomycetota bacterium]MBM4079188.1 glycosyltransferase family 4 protein [Planctomycetota bacterium]MBM4083778.1 glycosyltransferase family 4 protein [Planctomycetota bacterium]